MKVARAPRTAQGYLANLTVGSKVRAMADLTSQYAVSSADLQSALNQLTPARPHAPTQAQVHALPQTLSTSAALSSAQGQGGSLASSSEHALASPEAAEKQRRRLNEAWALLPYMGKTGPSSEKFFESVCEVDVGQWQ